MFHSFNTGEYLSKCLRSEKKKRMVTAEEMLGFPCNGPGRAAARVAHSFINYLFAGQWDSQVSSVFESKL